MSAMTAARRLVLFGAGGHAAKIVQAARDLGFDVVGYVSTEPSGTVAFGLPVLTDLAGYRERRDLEQFAAHIAIGEPSVRRRIHAELAGLGRELASIVSGRAFRAAGAAVGDGSCVLTHAVLQPRARLGRSTIVDTGAIVEHDCVVGDFVNVSPGAVLCGGVAVGDGAIVGAGAVVIEKIKVGADALIGAGSVVLSDVPDRAVVTGNPAKVLRERSPEEKYLR